MVVHGEIEGFYQQAIINAGKFLLHDGEIEDVGTVATGAANGVAAIVLYLVVSSLLDLLTGGDAVTHLHLLTLQELIQD